jgi:hypothetical protein
MPGIDGHDYLTFTASRWNDERLASAFGSDNQAIFLGAQVCYAQDNAHPRIQHNAFVENPIQDLHQAGIFWFRTQAQVAAFNHSVQIQRTSALLVHIPLALLRPVSRNLRMHLSVSVCDRDKDLTLRVTSGNESCDFFMPKAVRNRENKVAERTHHQHGFHLPMVPPEAFNAGSAALVDH